MTEIIFDNKSIDVFEIEDGIICKSHCGPFAYNHNTYTRTRTD